MDLQSVPKDLWVSVLGNYKKIKEQQPTLTDTRALCIARQIVWASEFINTQVFLDEIGLNWNQLSDLKHKMRLEKESI